MQRSSRAKWLWAAVLSSGFLIGGPVAALRAQQDAGEDKQDRRQQVSQAQVATVEQLKHEAFKQLRNGNFDRSDELIRTAASMQADDRTLALMSQWIGQYKSQRSDFLAERHKQYDKVVADVKKLLDAGKFPFAVDKATEAYTLSDNKENFSKEDWVVPIVQRGAELGAQYESAEQWLKAHNVEAATRTKFDEFLKTSPAAAAAAKTDTDREALFKQFQAWESERNARAQVPSKQK